MYNYTIGAGKKHKLALVFAKGRCNMAYIGVDIGGTKCAVCVGEIKEDSFTVIEKAQFPTEPLRGWRHACDRLCALAGEYAKKYPCTAVGISSGSPLDIKNGIVLSPPNLPTWDRVPITRLLAEATGLPAGVRNDADASALAEYRWGGGRGCRNMVFLTFGTGLGAGLVLDGRLYTGKSGTAGEAGHIPLAEDGPVGYGVKGSFEGFCSGGGIAALCKSEGLDCDAREAARLAYEGNEKALLVYEKSGYMLGKGLGVILDLIDPDVIVIGSIFQRSESLLRPSMERALRQYALPQTLEGLRIVPAQLGDNIGDAAALAVAELTGQAGKGTA